MKRLHAVAAGLLLCCAAVAQAAPAAADANWRWGSVDWTPCTIGGGSHATGPSVAAVCASFEVPENHADATGRRISLHMAVVRSLARDPEPDPVVFLDGGPGGAATRDYAAMEAAFEPLRKHRHILLIDQRGTGLSHPLRCEPDVADAHLREDLPVQGQRESGLQQLHQCALRLQAQADPRYYTTTDAIQDLEAVRIALGAPRFNLVGVSYGTRVAQQYARRYPSAVRTLALDGAVPNALVLLSEHARNLEDAVQARFATCRATPACVQHYGDPWVTLKQVQARLHARPVDVDIRDAQSFAPQRHRLGEVQLAALVRFYAYAPAPSALLPYVVAQAAGGQYGPLLSQSRFVSDDLQEQVAGGMEASVFCAEDADLLQVQPRDEGTLLGSRFVADAIAVCGVWPHAGRPAEFHQPLHSDVPALVFTGEFDPVTPPRYGREVVQGLSRGRMLELKGQGHAVASVGCMPQVLERFVRHANALALDATCLDALGDMPAFLDANGALP